ncbi:MAG: hypothetical protein U0840_01305 [Gemmataceae bacterium]
MAALPLRNQTYCVVFLYNGTGTALRRTAGFGHGFRFFLDGRFCLPYHLLGQVNEIHPS